MAITTPAPDNAHNPFDVRAPLYEPAPRVADLRAALANPAAITRLPDGRYVAADHQGKPLQDHQGRYAVFPDPSTLSHQQRYQSFRSTDPHVTHVRASADEAAAARAELIRRGLIDG